jgi:hypothetical protein
MIAPPPPAHFDVKVRAVQVIDWKQDYTAATCNGAVVEVTGSGRAEVHLHTPALQPVVARRLPNGTVTLSVRGLGVLPIAGSLSREGTTASRLLQPGTGPCSSPSWPPPPPRDCGTKLYAADAKLGLIYERGRFSVRGPASMSAPPFLNCPGSGLTEYWIDTKPVKLPARRLFGRRRRIEVKGFSHATVQTIRPGGFVLSGGKTATTAIEWKVVFRRAKRHRG